MNNFEQVHSKRWSVIKTKRCAITISKEVTTRRQAVTSFEGSNGVVRKGQACTPEDICLKPKESEEDVCSFLDRINGIVMDMIHEANLCIEMGMHYRRCFDKHVSSERLEAKNSALVTNKRKSSLVLSAHSFHPGWMKNIRTHRSKDGSKR